MIQLAKAPEHFAFISIMFSLSIVYLDFFSKLDGVKCFYAGYFLASIFPS